MKTYIIAAIKKDGDIYPVGGNGYWMKLDENIAFERAAMHQAWCDAMRMKVVVTLCEV